MTQYLIKRLLSMIPVLFGLTLLLFFLLRIIPGDAASVMLEDSPTARDKDQLRAELGLDRPVIEQYGLWIWHLAQGDLGTSYWTNRPVVKDIKTAAPITIELTLLSAVISLAVGVPLGVLSAARERSVADYLTRTVSIVFLAIPHFWLGTLVLILPAMWFGWAPPTSYVPVWHDPLANLQQLWLPSLVIGASAAASLMRMTRSAFLEVLNQDYIRTARAKGVGDWKVMSAHAMKNALIPIITLFGTIVAGLLTGAIVTETIFNLHGFGSLVVEAIAQRDYPTIQACVLIFGVVYSCVNLAVDISYGFLNPRVRYE